MNNSFRFRCSNRPTQTLLCTRLAVLLGGVLALAGCAHQAVDYSWSHLASGEYLFAFDTRECGELARGEAPAESARPAPTAGTPAFFACMHDRGYFLVDAISGRPLAGDITANLPGLPGPQAAR